MTTGDSANLSDLTQAFMTIVTVLVVGFNLLLGAGLMLAASWVWRSRLPLRRFARDLDQLDRELRAILPELPAQLATSREQLRDLNDRQQIAVARMILMRQVLQLLRQLSGRLTRWRSVRLAQPARSSPGQR